jgi:hypothetical protein
VVDVRLVGELEDLRDRVLEPRMAHREDVLLQRVPRNRLVECVGGGTLAAIRVLNRVPVARRDRRGVEFDQAALLGEVARVGGVELGCITRIKQGRDEQAFVVVDGPEPVLKRDVAERLDASLVQRSLRGELPGGLRQLRRQLETTVRRTTRVAGSVPITRRARTDVVARFPTPRCSASTLGRNSVPLSALGALAARSRAAAFARDGRCPSVVACRGPGPVDWPLVMTRSGSGTFQGLVDPGRFRGPS